MLSALQKIVTDPRDAYLRGMRRLKPEMLARQYGDKARQQGIDKLYLILSFDCDTEADYDVALDVHERLLDMGVWPSYAICGELLEKGADVYQKIHASGAEFLNHGGRRHTYFDDKVQDYRPCFFYNQQDEATLIEDIDYGDRAVTSVLGEKPVGYRAPHFGTFQTKANVSFIHEQARKLGYKYCSTTVPAYGLHNGPAKETSGITEFPVSGQGGDPFSILDSWGFIVRNASPVSYKEEALRALKFYKQAGAGILNYYADPSHVAGNEDFFEVISLWKQVAEPVSYKQLLEKMGRL